MGSDCQNRGEWEEVRGGADMSESNIDSTPFQN